MASAFGWGTLAASSLIIGAVAAIRLSIGLRAIGLIMGFGAGVLISAVAFDLVEEATNTQVSRWPVLIGIFAGCGVFFGGDAIIDRLGGADRLDACANPLDVGRDHARLGARLTRRLQPVPEFVAGRGRARARVRGGRDPD